MSRRARPKAARSARSAPRASPASRPPRTDFELVDVRADDRVAELRVAHVRELTLVLPHAAVIAE